MQALFYVGPEALELRETELSPLAPGESRVRIQATGICGSDLHAYHGHDPRRQPPLILGHEAAGVVVEGAMVGKRVTMNPLIVCGRCEYCLSGRQNLCSNRTMIGMTRAGSFAESLTIPDHCLIELPETLSPVVAALTEPAATALHGIQRLERVLARPLAEARVLVIGAGAVGLLAGLMLRQRGVRNLQLADTNPLRRQTAQEAGLDAFDPVHQALADDSIDAVFDCVGAAATRRMGVAVVRPGGAIMHLGLQDNEGSLDVRAVTLKEIAFLGAYTYTTTDLWATVALLDSGALGELGWVETRPLEEGSQAFADLAAGRTAAAKVVLLP
ncbi:alcohol dehydrogenase catalytic domain-containing protein [Halomonas sp. MCCC 1A17488]|uniref:Alcohol dehydrogenase catalytic domain-containing protein n=1 Tax=Billgrantia sulfidoxydans TaxID=2733484 RepID=A0ABX7W781_9GAMM|nr:MULTISPECIES: alcohol dehydrogenase catalytic domain-containing protein [Halomonas]MCE8017650.1 alcohol dehydrogenase catalytic domain-containing protein [Halomonas sp. MCCC 1A17488]MCG3240983.1 alcohol dehydrogenase catalytic domain-containing protein [Halomonas sp. MCCC 1A17488]QPP48851.1 alcohol dehydrogenase catalytic domain-containing protein [Halomonas sp. SS10-MC5]QTP56181.1 alcohol dehydrogenase catalytic domain-containing protein [Halomonas sulfidoxydans]